MRDRLSDEPVEETEARLQYMRDRLSDETGEEREARLQQMRTSQMERRSTETIIIISENIYHFTSATARLRSGSPHNALHFTSR